MRLGAPLAWSLLAGLSSVEGQYLVSELSFGYGSRYVGRSAARRACACRRDPGREWPQETW